MCDVTAFAVASVAVSATSAYASHKAGSSAAKAQREYNGEVAALQMSDRVMKLQEQNDTWEQDIKHAGDTLAWAEGEWVRQERAADKAVRAVEKNTLAATGQLLIRQVEEDIATVAQGMDARRTGTVARASRSAVDRGVEGNSVDGILNDVFRQEGEAVNVMAMNRAAGLRQINRQIIEADAQGDQQLANIAVRTFAPQTPIRQPGVLGSVAPAAPVQGPSTGQLIGNIAGAVVQGVGNYSSWNGQTVKDTVDGARTWIGKQFAVAPSAGSAGRG